MQRACWLMIVLMLPAISVAQDIKPDDLRKLYNNTLTELKAAQDRKAELAAENARLTTRVSDLEKQLAAKSQQVEDLNQTAAEMADQTVLLRAHYAAWQEFMTDNPSVGQRWEYFLEAAEMSNGSLSLMQTNWPLQAEPATPPAGPRPVEVKPPVGAVPSTGATRMVPTTASTAITATSVKRATAPTPMPTTHLAAPRPTATTTAPAINKVVKTTQTTVTTGPSTASQP